MADKPSRALVVYGEGFAATVNQSHEGLHSLAALSACGFLALRSSPPDSPSATVGQLSGNIRELSQLLDAYESLDALNKDPVDIDPNIQLQNRFTGMRAAFCTADSTVGSFTRKLGFKVIDVNELSKKSSLASELLTLLGFSGGKISENYDFDLVIFHISKGIDYLDELVRSLLALVQPGSETTARFHFSVVLSFGEVKEGKGTSALISPVRNDSDLSLLLPCQSYCMKGGKRLDDIRHHHPMLVAQWQEGVTRRDLAEKFSFEEFHKHGGNLAILADRFLHELAFKLWKAPKYGA